MAIVRRLRTLFSGLASIRATCGVPSIGAATIFWWRAGLVMLQARIPKKWRSPQRFDLVWNERMFSVWIPDRTGFAVLEEVFVQGEYHVDDIAPPSTIVDAGANIGVASLYFACVYPSARIYAIEPDPDTAQILRKNTEQFSHISVHEVALCDRDGEIDFYMRPQSAIGSSIIFRDGSQLRRVRSVTMDTFMQEHGLQTLDLLKFDVEGAEDRMLGAIRAPGVIQVYVGEIHEDLMASNIDELLKKFDGLKTVLTPIAKQRSILRIYT